MQTAWGSWQYKQLVIRHLQSLVRCASRSFLLIIAWQFWWVQRTTWNSQEFKWFCKKVQKTQPCFCQKKNGGEIKAYTCIYQGYEQFQPLSLLVHQSMDNLRYDIVCARIKSCVSLLYREKSSPEKELKRKSSKWAFSSPEAAFLLVRTKNHNFWEGGSILRRRSYKLVTRSTRARLRTSA